MPSSVIPVKLRMLHIRTKSKVPESQTFETIRRQTLQVPCKTLHDNYILLYQPKSAYLMYNASSKGIKEIWFDPFKKAYAHRAKHRRRRSRPQTKAASEEVLHGLQEPACTFLHEEGEVLLLRTTCRCTSAWTGRDRCQSGATCPSRDEFFQCTLDEGVRPTRPAWPQNSSSRTSPHTWNILSLNFTVTVWRPYSSRKLRSTYLSWKNCPRV